MFRYRCPQCRQILQAPEIRAGKATVCPKCSQKITIPADPKNWLNETGESAAPSNSIRPSQAERPPSVRELEIPVDELAPIKVADPIVIATASPPAVTVPPPPLAAAAEQPVAKVPPPPAPVVAKDPPPPTQAPTPAVPIVAKQPPIPAKAPTPAVVEEPPVAAVAEPATVEVKTAPPKSAPEKAPVLPSSAPTTLETPAISPPVEVPSRSTIGSGSIPKPRPRQVRATPAIVTANGASDDGVNFNPPLHLRSEMDIAAALTDVLTTRMKPPPKPPRDLYLSTAFWLLLTGISLALLGLTLFRNVNHLMWVAYIGAAQIAIGYVWIVILVFRRQPSPAVPVTALWALTKRRYRSYRPLRFVLTGALLIVMAYVAPSLLSNTRNWSGADVNPLQVVEPEVSTLSELDQLRKYRENRQFDKLVALLNKLDKTDPTFSKSASQRTELAAELRSLCNPQQTSDTTVRAAALPAYTRWSSGDEARDVLLVAVQGHPDERREAIRLLSRWHDDAVARVLASRLSHREESILAKNALIDIGGPVAVQAIIPLLRDKEKDKVLHLAALDLLANPRISDETALAFLRTEKDKFTDQTLVRQSEEAILKIMNNLRQKQEK